jgi:PAS domain S-box-containing protein
MSIKILHLRSPSVSGGLVEDVLNDSGVSHDLFIAKDKVAFLAGLHSFNPDVILCDDEFPLSSPLDPVIILTDLQLTTPLVVVNCSPCADFARRAINIMKHGAYDYLTKDNIQELPEALTAAVEKNNAIKIANAETNLYLNTVDEVFFSRDLNTGELIRISPGCEAVYGYTSRELITELKYEGQIYHPSDWPLLQSIIQRLKNGEQVTARYRIIDKDKQVRWLESKVTPTVFENGQVTRVDGITRNVTKAKAAEDKLKESEQRFRELLENSDDMIMISDTNGDITYLSPNLTKILGYKPEEFTADNIGREFAHPDHQKEYYSVYFDIRKNPGKSTSITGRFKHGGGYWIWLEITVINLLHIPSVNGIVSNFRDITERKVAEEKLLHSEERYRQIVETSQEGIWLVDKDFLTVFVNKKMCDMLGYGAEEIIGKYNYEFKNEEGREKGRLGLEKRPVGGTETHETTFVTKNGDHVLLSVTTNSIIDDTGQHLGTLAMLTDITQRKADEDALKRSEANLSAIIENTTDLVYSLDRDLRFITFNQFFKTTIKQVYGFDVAQGVNTVDMLAGFDAEVAKKWKDIYARALAGETIQFVNEYNFNNTRVWLSYSVNPIRETGNVIGLSCFSRDITQQKLDEEALKKSEASLRTIFNNTDMAIVLIDSENRIVQFNTLAEKFAEEQYGIAVAKGDSVLDHVSDRRREHLLSTLAKVKNGEFVNYQMNREINGTEKWFDITWGGIKNQNNEDFGYIFTNKDITEKKKLEIEREKITADLIQRNKDLEQFTYIISHNLRAPVANIIGLSTLLNEFKNAQHEYSDTIDGIAVSANKLDAVILDLNQILQVSKSNEKVEVVSLTELIDDIQTSINHLIEKENVRIQCDFAGGDSIFTLKSYLYSIFYNLILNSIKYHNPGVLPVINITSKTADSKIHINYRDNGRGIDMVKNAKSLFGLYKRFDMSVEGKGMGLFMVKMQVESLGGTIALQSELNEGTRFELEFPINNSYKDPM